MINETDVSLAKASKELGSTVVQKMLSKAQAAYVAWKLPSFRAKRVYGSKATLAIWNKTVQNASEPGVTYVCSMWPSKSQFRCFVQNLFVESCTQACSARTEQFRGRECQSESAAFSPE